jgi:hypothetical protein
VETQGGRGYIAFQSASRQVGPGSDGGLGGIVGSNTTRRKRAGEKKRGVGWWRLDRLVAKTGLHVRKWLKKPRFPVTASDPARESGEELGVVSVPPAPPSRVT